MERAVGIDINITSLRGQYTYISSHISEDLNPGQPQILQFTFYDLPEKES